MPQAAWMKRALFAAFALVVIAAVVAGCGGGGSSSSSSTREERVKAVAAAKKAAAVAGVKIALLLPENETPRYETNDKPTSKKRSKNSAPDVKSATSTPTATSKNRRARAKPH